MQSGLVIAHQLFSIFLKQMYQDITMDEWTVGVVAAGVQDRVRIIFCDYRDVAVTCAQVILGRVDIHSISMYIFLYIYIFMYISDYFMIFCRFALLTLKELYSTFETHILGTVTVTTTVLMHPNELISAERMQV